MIKQPKKLIPFFGLYLTTVVFLLTCGIDEYFYLPQVPEGNISIQLNTDATINLPPLDTVYYYYALNYLIYYRIYISGHSEPGEINTQALRTTISSSLNNDFTAIYPNTNPISTSAGTPAGTLFKNRGYFELELEGLDIRNLLTTSGGNINISFPPVSIPVLLFNGSLNYCLLRSKELISPEPVVAATGKPNLYFENTTELSDPAKANANINADVAGISGLSQSYAYVSMYVVAAGINPNTFTPIYSRPTHIGIFKLPG